MNKVSKFSPTILRIGIAIVFLWFGVNQIIDTTAWIGYIPDWVVSISGLTAATVVKLNALFEIVFGTALLLGFFTRFAAFVLMLHMFDITFTVGLDAIGMRDLGLSIATLSVWLNGYDALTLDSYIWKDSVLSAENNAVYPIETSNSVR